MSFWETTGQKISEAPTLSTGRSGRIHNGDASAEEANGRPVVGTKTTQRKVTTRVLLRACKAKRQSREFNAGVKHPVGPKRSNKKTVGLKRPNNSKSRVRGIASAGVVGAMRVRQLQLLRVATLLSLVMQHAKTSLAHLFCRRS